MADLFDDLEGSQAAIDTGSGDATTTTPAPEAPGSWWPTALGIGIALSVLAVIATFTLSPIIATIVAIAAVVAYAAAVIGISNRAVDYIARDVLHVRPEDVPTPGQVATIVLPFLLLLAAALFLLWQRLRKRK